MDSPGLGFVKSLVLDESVKFPELVLGVCVADVVETSGRDVEKVKAAMNKTRETKDMKLIIIIIIFIIININIHHL